MTEPEPVVSIIFYVAKIAIAVVALPVAWLVIFANPGMATRLRRHSYDSIAAYGSYRKALNRTAGGVAIMWVTLASGVAWCGYRFVTFADFSPSVVEKITEDAVAFGAFFCLWGTTSLCTWYLVYPFDRGARSDKM